MTISKQQQRQRRKLLKDGLSLGTLAATKVTTAGVAVGGLSTISGCSSSLGEGNITAPAYDEDKPAPWVNWATNQYCYPDKILTPNTEDQLANILKETKNTIRPVGAGHSFSAVVPTDTTLLSTDLLTGLISHSEANLTAQFYAGTRLHTASRQLASVNQAFWNLPDMDYPSLAGSVVNSVHGTGPDFMSMSGYVSALSLVAPNGEIYECDNEHHPEIFNAAKTSVGALGVISKVTFRNTEPFELTERTEMANTEDILDDIQQHFSNHRNFEIFAFPLTERCAVIKTDYAQSGDTNFGSEEPNLLNELKLLYELTGRIPIVGTRLYAGIIKGMEPNDGLSSIRTGPSYEVLCHQRQTRFREMEYTVPVEVGPACLREILNTIKTKNLPINIPIEYRHTKKDDIWLSMFEGMDGASISIHQHEQWQYEKVFSEIEPIFRKYNGRPHWGKLHTLKANQLAEIYQYWPDFNDVRKELDPQGKMLNKHLKDLFVA